VSIASVSFTRHSRRVIVAMLATYGISAAQAENPADRADRADKGWPLIVTADHADECEQALALGQQAQQDGGLAATFSLLNWNVEKAKDPSLVSEFAELARLSDLIFLQEAVPLKKTQTVIEQSLFEAFVRGYVQDEVETGVLTLARTPHLVHCQLLATEPWLRTPKATSVTLYPLADSDDTLLTVNLHAVNFSFGVKAYQGQLNTAAELIRSHEGPVIFGGDLNTWSDKRQGVLDSLTDELELIPVPFSPDHRTTQFGKPLDHLFVRGLAWQSTKTKEVSTSDHNPLFATLRREDP
jgi:endonuclease/exonuclease/phosphatase (EEP) superfamily protein YafD